jgi:hypothetical protein
LFDNPFDAAGAYALVNSPYFERLENLDLTCTLGDYEPEYGQVVEALVRRFGKRVHVTMRD